MCMRSLLQLIRQRKQAEYGEVNFSQPWLANFAGLLGSSARKTVQWTVFSENGLASPGGKSRNLQAADG